ncbi:ANKR7 protein, partial [Amia calva]|nr:ANKR7 protein [Amia calva]
SRTLLHVACVSGQEEVVAFLAEQKTTLDLCDGQHRSALMKAVQCGQQGCVAALLKHGADPNVMDVDGNTALHFAALVPSVVLAAQLVRHGADIEARNKEGCTPLLLATAENHIRVVTLLLKKGTEINTRDKSMRWAAVHFSGPQNDSDLEKRQICEREGRGVSPLLLKGYPGLDRITEHRHGPDGHLMSRQNEQCFYETVEYCPVTR